MEEVIEKVVLSLIGCAIVGAGIAFASSFGAGVMKGLNSDFRQSGRMYRYPPWFHRFFGGMLIVFGLIYLTVVLVFHLGPAHG
jgi:hypothetical protein